MSSDAIAILGFAVLFVLMLLRVPVGMAMGLVGVSGFAYIVGGPAALKNVGHTTMRTVTDYNFAVVPLFLLMGAFATTSGMSRELFRGANAFLGHLRGGLGIATIAACGGFAAICGSSVATAATFSKVAYPEMRSYGYPQSFATGAGARRFGCGEHAAIDAADDEGEQEQRRPDITQGLDALLPGAAGAGGQEARARGADDRDGDHVHGHRQNAWQHSGDEELPHVLLGDQPVDCEHRRRRNHDAERTARGDHAGGEGLGVTVGPHFGIGDL